MPDEPQFNPVAMSAGLPSTVLPPADPDAEARLADALPLRRGPQVAVSRAAGGTPLPRRVGDARRPGGPRRSSATRTTGSATTAASTRCAPTGGAGRATCAGGADQPGFLRALAGLGAMATAIGEDDEADRIALFLAQLDPGRRPAFDVPGRRRLCGGASRRMGTRQGVRRGRRGGDGGAGGRGAGGRRVCRCAVRRRRRAALAALGRPVLRMATPGRGRRERSSPRSRQRSTPTWSSSPPAISPMLDADTVVAVVGDGVDDLARVAHTDRLEPLLACVAACGARRARGAVRLAVSDAALYRCARSHVGVRRRPGRRPPAPQRQHPGRPASSCRPPTAATRGR